MLVARHRPPGRERRDYPAVDAGSGARAEATQHVRRRQEAPTTRMRGRMHLTGRKRRTLDGRFEAVVVAVGAMPLDQRDPTQAWRRRARRRTRHATTTSRGCRRARSRVTGSSIHETAHRCARPDRWCRRLRRRRSPTRCAPATADTIGGRRFVHELVVGRARFATGRDAAGAVRLVDGVSDHGDPLREQLGLRR